MPPAPIVSLVLGEPALAVRVAEAALARGVFAQAVVPPAVAPERSGLRLTPMASHRAGELRAAARSLAQARHGTRDSSRRERRRSRRSVFDFEARAA